LIDGRMFDGVLIMVLVTSIAGPLLTARFARQVPAVEPRLRAP